MSIATTITTVTKRMRNGRAPVLQSKGGTTVISTPTAGTIPTDPKALLTSENTFEQINRFKKSIFINTVDAITDDTTILKPLVKDATTGEVKEGKIYEVIQLACSDETTALTTGTKITFRMPFAMTLTAIPRGSLTTAATGATLLTFDIKENGTTIYSTKSTFDAGEKTTTTAATAAVLSDTTLADDAEMTVIIDSIGSTIAGAGLKVTLIGYRT